MRLDKDKIIWVGWCRDEKKNVDKVWGVITIKPEEEMHGGDLGIYVAFRGRRGKTLQTTIHTDKLEWDIKHTLVNSKKRKKYVEIDVNDLNDVYPEFEEDLDWTTVEAKLSV